MKPLIARLSLALVAVLFALCVNQASAQSVLPNQNQNQNDDRNNPNHGHDLIAWTEFQKPQPVPQRPQPVPPPDAQSGQQQASGQGQSSNETQNTPNSQSQKNREQDTQSNANTLTGTIAKAGSKYVLEAGDNTVYQLDDQEQAQKYEGKQVKVTGTLDRATALIYVRSIELLS
jgi:hypothetical protein